MSSSDLNVEAFLNHQDQLTLVNCTFSTSIAKSLQTFQKNQCLCDVEIATAELGSKATNTGNTVFAHSCVLASASSFFHRLLTDGELKDQAKKLILLRKINLHYVKLCIDFIYGHTIVFYMKEIPCLIQAADMFKIQSLLAYCKSVMHGNDASVFSQDNTNLETSANLPAPANLPTQLKNSTDGTSQSRSLLNKVKNESGTALQLLKLDSGNKIMAFVNKDSNQYIGHLKVTGVPDEAFPTIKKEVTDDYKQETAEQNDVVDSLDSTVHLKEVSLKDADFIYRRPHHGDHTYSVSHLIHDESDNVATCSISGTANVDSSQDAARVPPRPPSGSVKKIRSRYGALGPYRKSYASLREQYAFRKLKESRPTKCKHCGETFKNYHTMRSHLNKLYQPKLPCQYCGKTFIIKAALNTHELRHKGEKNFKCQECDFTAVTKAEIGMHKVKHQGNKNCMCDFCGVWYKCQKTLNLHIKRVHDESVQKFECEYCDYKAPIQSMITTHMRIHKATPRHECAHCDRSYKTRSRLKTHLFKKHDITVPHLKHTLFSMTDETMTRAKELEEGKSTNIQPLNTLGDFSGFTEASEKVEDTETCPSNVNPSVADSSGLANEDLQATFNIQNSYSGQLNDFV